jgi:DNA-binding NarL/FixJ family response regulator
MEIVGEAGNAADLLEVVASQQPDIAIVDIRMPPTGTDEGLQAAAQLGRTQPHVAVLVLSEFLEFKYATRLLDAGTPGRGYLLKQTVTELDDFVGAVRRIAAGQSVVDPELVRLVMRRARDRDPIALLTEREREILSHMAQGRSNAGIAELMFMSSRTVEGHIAKLFDKLGLEAARDDNRRVLAVLTFLNTR